LSLLLPYLLESFDSGAELVALLLSPGMETAPEQSDIDSGTSEEVRNQMRVSMKRCPQEEDEESGKEQGGKCPKPNGFLSLSMIHSFSSPVESK